MKKWIEDYGVYSLYFTPYYDDDILMIQFKKDDDGDWYVFTSKELGIEYDCEEFNNVEDMKEYCEDLVYNHFEENVIYAEEMFNKWKGLEH